MTALTRRWSAVWPKLLAVGLVIAAWQALYMSGWRPPYVLPSPATVAAELGQLATSPTAWAALATTLQRAAVGYALAVLIGSAVGLAVARVPVLRRAIGALITGLQSMPSIAWFPLAILLFGLSEAAILFVVVLGAAPSAANGVIAGIDQVPPPLLRMATTMGARGWPRYRDVVIPAALPAVVAGLKQGWSFAWRSLMAGELLVALGRAALGQQLSYARDLADTPRLIAFMIVILVVGMVVDGLFGVVDIRLRRRRGLISD